MLRRLVVYSASVTMPAFRGPSNIYIEKRSLAYLANRLSLPVIKSYFEDRGIKVNDDSYALSEMIQWVWRSGIRRGDPITVFIPSDRSGAC
jgi:hypothetical protein